MSDFDTLTSQYSSFVTTHPAVDALLVLTGGPGREAFSSPSPPRSTNWVQYRARIVQIHNVIAVVIEHWMRLPR